MKRIILIYFFVQLTFILAFSQADLSGIVINEISDEGTEFVELYNTNGSGSVDISGWEIYDNSSKRATIGASTTLNSGERIVIIVSGLNNTGDQVILYNPSTNTFIAATYDNGPASVLNTEDLPATATQSGSTENFGTANAAAGDSYQRIPDGSSNIEIAPATSGEENTLPVELLSFTATQKEKSILLNWATATEINNDHFLVEYSRDGLGFKSIAQIDGMGNSIDEVKYEFMHEKANAGTNYYRLKQMDFDGAFEYSNVVSLTIESDKDISIQPNLVKDNMKLVVKKGYTKELSVEIFNILGAKVMEAKLPAGALEQNLEVQQLQKGHYFLRVNTNEKPRVLRFVKL